MKGPGITAGMVFALLAGIGGGVLDTLAEIVFGPANALRLVVALSTLAYLLFLLRNSPRREGRVMVMIGWLVFAAGGSLIGLDLLPWIGLLLLMIWLVRVTYFHSGAIAALADLVLVVLGGSSSVWALLQTGSVGAALWCFFLTQTLHELIPPIAHRGVPARQVSAEDRFDSAYRAAREAVRQLSTR